MNRIKTKIQSLGKNKLLIPFFTAGYPSDNALKEYVNISESSGADMIEIGIPFSDPLADGPEIQHSSKAALDNGITLKKILSQVETIRKTTDIPLILMGYYNPILSYGDSKFFKDASNAGVDGLIIPDLPVDEAVNFKKAAESNNLSVTFLVSPTSDEKRVKLIDQASTDFVYAVTVTGVTGSGKKFDNTTDKYLKSLKDRLSLRFVAGFGVSSAESAKRLCRYSDGIVIGSALVKKIREAKNRKDSYKGIERFLKSIRKVI